MPDLSTPVIVAAGFVGIGWLILRAGPRDADAIRHTLSIFALAIGLVVMAGVTAKLRAGLRVGRMTHRVEARSQIERPAPVRPNRDSGERAHP